jgi:uncharacterized protein with GYD domain
MKITSYDTIGPYDVIVILESPTEELALKFLAQTGASGNVETVTLRGYTREEIERIWAH